MLKFITVKENSIKWIDGERENERIGVFFYRKNSSITIGFRREVRGKEVASIKNIYQENKIDKTIEIGLSDFPYYVKFNFDWKFRKYGSVDVMIKTEENE